VPLVLPAAAAPSSATCPRDPALGTVAFVRSGSLRFVSLSDCRERVLVARGAGGPVRFSPDGRYIAFGSGVVAARGGPVLRGHGIGWAPGGHPWPA
jgi:hypothetical protein